MPWAPKEFGKYVDVSWLNLCECCLEMGDGLWYKFTGCY